MSSELLPQQLPPAHAPTPPPSPTTDAHIISLELGIINEATQQNLNHYAEEVKPEVLPRPPAAQNQPYPEWLSLIMSFCFAGISIGFQSIRASNHLPLSFHLAGLGVVFALAAFVVSKYISAYLRREAQLLENAGVFFGVTAFLLDITLSFPLCLKIISWVIYVSALLAIILFPILRWLSIIPDPVEQKP